MKKLITIFLLTLFILTPVSTTFANGLDNLAEKITTSADKLSTELSKVDNTTLEDMTTKDFVKLVAASITNRILTSVNEDIQDLNKSKNVNTVESEVATLGLTTGPLAGKTITIDPGHGNPNPGAKANGAIEADINLAVSKKLKTKLEAAGATVVMTRETDKSVAKASSSLGTELQARLDIANKNNSDIFVSMHSNYNDNANYKGAMTFYPTGKSDDLAEAVQEGLIKATGAIDKGAVEGNFYVLRKASIPSILVEMGFITNEDEAKNLTSNAYQDKIAQGVYQGILNFFN